MFINVSGNEEANGHLGTPNGGINIAPFNWNQLPSNSATITPDTWRNYALSWGDAGLRFYIDGDLVSSNSNTDTLNPSTGWWAVGVAGSSAIGSPGQGFNGTMDELRISNVQRDFAAIPEPAFSFLLVIGLQFVLGRKALRRVPAKKDSTIRPGTWRNRGPL